MSLKTSLNLFLLFAILAPIAIGAQVSWEPSQSLVKIVTQSHDQYRLLDRLGMPIVDVQDNYVKALATPEQLARVRAMGFPVEVLSRIIPTSSRRGAILRSESRPRPEPRAGTSTTPTPRCGTPSEH